MLVYAAGMLVGGGAAFLLAPANANAATALLVPGIAAALMALSAMGAAMLPRNRKLGMIGIHIGLVLPIIFAAGMVPRALAAGEASASYNELAAEYSEQTGAVAEQDPEAFVAWQTARDGQAEPVDHDKAYLATTLWSLTAWSALAFVGILSRRPKPADRGPNEEGDDAEEGKPQSSSSEPSS